MTLTMKNSLWLRWMAANAISEMLGLGGSFAAIALVYSRLGDRPGLGIAALTFLATIACGAIEATIVGLAQWWAMHPWFPSIRRIQWWLGTLTGALIAYGLGYLPSTLMSMGEQAGQATSAEPPQWLTLLLAAGLGMVAGAMLSFAQWLVLRKKVARSGWWVPANMLAWTAGMPLIFAGVDLAQKSQPLAVSLITIAIALILMGAVVGAIEGAVLARLAASSVRS